MSGGNKRFREAITRSLDEYRKATSRPEKAVIVQRILDGVSNAGGRFLKKNPDTGEWYELSEQQTKEKVSHAVRDAANTMDARKGQGSGKLKTTKDKAKKLPMEPSRVAAFASRGGVDSGNFYENLDRATREIRRHASDPGATWYGLDQPRTFPDEEAMGSTSERLPIRAVRDIQIPGQHHFHRMTEVPEAQTARTTRVMDGNIVPGLGTRARAQPDIQGQSVAGLLLHGARRPDAIMLPEGPRIGFANAPQNAARASSAPPQPPAVPRPIHQQHSSDEGDNFLARINDVLGPLPADEHDPMGSYLGQGRVSKDK